MDISENMTTDLTDQKLNLWYQIIEDTSKKNTAHKRRKKNQSPALN